MRFDVGQEKGRQQHMNMITTGREVDLVAIASSYTAADTTTTTAAATTTTTPATTTATTTTTTTTAATTTTTTTPRKIGVHPRPQKSNIACRPQKGTLTELACHARLLAFSENYTLLEPLIPTPCPKKKLFAP